MSTAPLTAEPDAPAVDARTYADLCDELKSIGVLQAVEHLVSWDQETKMPPRGADSRADQLETLNTLIHQRSTSTRLADLIAACEDDPAVTDDPVAGPNVREVRRDFDKATKLPADLVAEIARTSSHAMHAWKTARADSDFAAFEPWLAKTVELARRKAQCYGAPAGGELYDALMDDYEPGMTAERVAQIFEPLRAFTVDLLHRVRDAEPADTAPATIAFPLDDQRRWAERVIAAIGFDLEAGRCDDATHPFCQTVAAGDVRLTNRYRDDGWTDCLSSGMHEAGHGMYEQGLPMNAFPGQPAAQAVSLGIHESQSRLWENQVGRGMPFWTWATPIARDLLGGALAGVAPEQIHRACNAVQPSFIRVEADEVTYNLHIMLRFDLERAMIAGELAVKDLPAAWNDRMKGDLALDVPEDRLGCLQDIHWSMGALGYFATYTLGNLYAAQLWEAIDRDLPDRDQRIAAGDFAPILHWLRHHIHRHGRRFPAEELCRRATGQALDPQPLMRHLTAKVDAVYP